MPLAKWRPIASFLRIVSSVVCASFASTVSLHDVLTALPTRSERISHCLIVQGAVAIWIPCIRASKWTRHNLLRSILGAAAASRNAEVTGQVAGLEHDPRTAALRLALLTGTESTARVLDVAEVERNLGGTAVVGTVAETMVLEATAGGAEAVEVVCQGVAPAGVVFGLVGDLAFDADVFECVDCGCGGGWRVAVWKELATRFEAAVRTCGDFSGVGAAWVKGIACSVQVGCRWCCSSGCEKLDSERR